MFDSLTIAALADELSLQLLDGYVQKVVQLDDRSVGLEIYANHQRQFLVASADSRNPRVYLSSTRVAADPDRVSPLLLLLRKYARGGRVVAIEQPALERILRVSIAKRFWPDKNDDDPDEAAEVVYVTLIVELMGRRSNILLINEAGRVLDAIKRVTPEMSRVRPILPGRHYEPPPPQEKLDPRGVTINQLAGVLHQPGNEPVAERLVRALTGFSPQMAREVTFRALGASDAAVPPEEETVEVARRLAGAIAELLSPLETNNWQPHLYLEDGDPVAFAPIALASLDQTLAAERTSTLSEAIERATTAGSEPKQVRYARRREKLVAQIATAADRVRARLHSLREEEERAGAAERWRTMGELIYAYLYQIEPGQTELDVEGWRISLDPAKSPSENAQEYFERYRKGQSARENLPELIAAAQTELAYLDELRTLAGLAEGLDELEQLRREWEEWSAPAVGQARAPKRPAQPKRPRPFRTERGDLIYVGHNGRQNEIVTFELAGPDDTWLHARGMPGAHVIVRWAGEEDPALLERAASLPPGSAPAATPPASRSMPPRAAPCVRSKAPGRAWSPTATSARSTCTRGTRGRWGWSRETRSAPAWSRPHPTRSLASSRTTPSEPGAREKGNRVGRGPLVPASSPLPLWESLRSGRG